MMKIVEVCNSYIQLQKGSKRLFYKHTAYYTYIIYTYVFYKHNTHIMYRYVYITHILVMYIFTTRDAEF